MAYWFDAVSAHIRVLGLIEQRLAVRVRQSVLGAFMGQRSLRENVQLGYWINLLFITMFYLFVDLLELFGELVCFRGDLCFFEFAPGLMRVRKGRNLFLFSCGQDDFDRLSLLFTFFTFRLRLWRDCLSPRLQLKCVSLPILPSVECSDLRLLAYLSEFAGFSQVTRFRQHERYFVLFQLFLQVLIKIFLSPLHLFEKLFHHRLARQIIYLLLKLSQSLQIL